MPALWKHCAWIGFVLVALGLAPLGAALAERSTPAERLAQDGDEPPAPLEAERERTELEQDRLTAAAMFAHGRLLFQREQYAEALRRYQRAYRYNPQAVHILDQIVPLAFELEHNESAARYAVIAAEKNPKDAILLRRLAMHLTEKQQHARALKLYGKSFELKKEGDDITAVLLKLEMGRLHFLEGNYAEAAEAFGHVRDAIADPQKFGLSAELQKIILGNAQATYSLLGESFLQAGKYDEAEAMFVKADEAEEDKPRLAFLLARVRMKQNKPDEALRQLEEYFAAKADSAGLEAYELLGEALRQQHSDESAARAALLQRLEKLAADNADDVALGVAYGKALRQSEQLDRATEVLEKSLEKQVTTEAAAELVEIYRQQNKPAELLALLGKSTGKGASLSVLGQPGEELKQDAELIGKLVALAKEKKAQQGGKLPFGEAWSVAMLAVEAKDFDAADAFYAVALENPPKRSGTAKGEAALTWGVEMLQAEQYERAAKVFQQAIDNKWLSDREELLHFFLAGTLEMQGQTDAALAAIDQAIAKGKPSSRLLSRKAWIQYHAKRYAEAEQTYREVLAKFDGDHKSADNRQTMREARLVLSNICVQTNRRAEGTEWLEQVLDEDPEDVGAMNDLGYLWAEAGQHLHRALKLTQQAVAAQPDNAAYRDSLGWAYYQLGRYEEAVAELEKAAAEEEPDGVILDHLGDAYAGLKQMDKAVATWQRAVAAFEKEKESDKLEATRQKIAAQQNK